MKSAQPIWGGYADLACYFLKKSRFFSFSLTKVKIKISVIGIGKCVPRAAIHSARFGQPVLLLKYAHRGGSCFIVFAALWDLSDVVINGTQLLQGVLNNTDQKLRFANFNGVIFGQAGEVRNP